MYTRDAKPEDADTIATLHTESWCIAYRGMFRDSFLDGDVFLERKKVLRQRLSEQKQNQLVLIH